MTPEEYKWRIELVRNRYEQYQLTFIQAEQIYQYEEEVNHPSPKYYYSPWEEWDHQYIRFKEILNGQQFDIFESNWRERVQSYEAAIVKEDEDMIPQLQMMDALLNYHRHIFIPAIIADPQISVLPFRNNKHKVAFLANEYRSFLKDLNAMRTVEHFRFSRRFQPNKLKLVQLQYQLDAVIPNMVSFSSFMDAPSKIIADHVASSTQYLLEEAEQKLDKIYANLAAFHHETQQKYQQPTQGGFSVTLQVDTLSEKRNRILETAILSELHRSQI